MISFKFKSWLEKKSCGNLDAPHSNWSFYYKKDSYVILLCGETLTKVTLSHSGAKEFYDGLENKGQWEIIEETN